LHVKICGITNPADAVAAVEAGADALGLIFAPSPRRVTLDDARAIRLVVPARVEMTGVFVREPLALVHDAILTVGLGGVQFHGNPLEHWADAERVRWEELIQTRKALRVVHAVRAKDATALEAALDTRMERADQILLDAFVPGLEGGTGRTFDWSLIEIVKRRGVPVIVAGGLTPGNVAEAVGTTQPWGVDVSSGVESAPGKKDHGAVRRFIRAARAADAPAVPVW
jgi:phosphoribosylanthranilate isomerase